MPGYARREIVREGEVGVYHCVARCVRRAFLCGQDPVSGNDYEHRKVWLQRRLEELAGIFGIEVVSYSILGNHLHVVLRTRPDVVGGWSDEEIARRTWRLFPQRRDKEGRPAEPEEHELRTLTACPESLRKRRRRLASLSWFMRCLCEPIARRANREDCCTGRFWEGRFKSQALLDEAAVLACSLYVDLNPIRAAVCDRPEEAEFTSAHDRIVSRQAQRGKAARQAVSTRQKSPRKAIGGSGRQDSASPSQKPREHNRRRPVPDRDGWLCPIRPERPSLRTSAPRCSDSDSPAKSPTRNSPPRRASEQPCLLMNLDEYLRLLDWTGRQIRADKRGAIPEKLSPILERLSVSPDGWVEGVREFGRWFRRAVGSPERVLAEASRSGKRWFGGVSRCRQAFT